MAYSQHNEEEIIANYLGDVVNGTYVDIGAGHATEISNTYGLYLKGWTGLTIDPNGARVCGEGITQIDGHKKYRPNDIHLVLAVVDYDGEIDMCDVATAESYLGVQYSTIGTPSTGTVYPLRKEKCLTFNTLISQYPQFAAADFFSLDVETSEERVLTACDFEKFTPTLMIIENKVWKGKDLRSNWIHFIDPYYDLVETVPGNLVFLRKS